MDAETYEKYIAAGLQAGEERTCGEKIRYGSERSAAKAATSMNKKVAPKVLKAYPCAFCFTWHIGRKMNL